MYLLGDFKTVFDTHEVHQRSYSDLEKRHSNQVEQIIEALALNDIWQNNRCTHTWRQLGSKKSSRLDRIYYQHHLRTKSCKVDWTFTNSDHGAVTATFTDGSNSSRSRPLRLNPELIKDNLLKTKFLDA